MSKYPPIYKFEASDARNPKAVDVTLKYDTPQETEGKFGTQYKYSVTINGTDYTVFATPGLHRAIESTGARANETVSVIRIGSGKETKWDVIHADQFGTNAAENHGTPNEDPFVSKQDASNYKPKKNARTTYYDNLRRYEIAWDIAERFAKKQGTDQGLNAIAFTFYKMAQDADYDLLQEQQGEQDGAEGKA